MKLTKRNTTTTQNKTLAWDIFEGKKSSSQINRKKSVDWQTKCIYNARKNPRREKHAAVSAHL